jgi:hypothetical protein
LGLLILIFRRQTEFRVMVGLRFAETPFQNFETASLQSETSDRFVEIVTEVAPLR